MAGRDTGLVPVLPAHTLTRSYWTVMHEDLRTIRRVALVADFLSEIVARDKAMF